MAETFNNLYSVGPGSIGPGTHVTQSLFDPQQNRGTITRMYKDDNGISVGQLASLYTLSDPVFPGTAILLRDTFVRQISDKLALVVSRYGSSSGGSGFKTVMTRTPSGFRTADYYSVKEAYTKDSSNYVNLVTGRLRPERTLSFPIMTIRWSSIVYQDSRPNDNASLIGKINSNNYSIDGYFHAAQSLKFGGTRVRHDKWGGYDRWTLNHTAYWDRLGLWRTGGVIRGDKRDDGSGTWEFTLANNGDGIATYGPDDLVSFPNLP